MNTITQLTYWIAPGYKKLADVHTIEDAVCDLYNIDISILKGKLQTRRATEPRHVIMYLLCKYTILPLQKIGLRYNGRDHSTVINARNKIQGYRDIDPDFDRKVSKIEDKIIGNKIKHVA